MGRPRKNMIIVEQPINCPKCKELVILKVQRVITKPQSRAEYGYEVEVIE